MKFLENIRLKFAHRYDAEDIIDDILYVIKASRKMFPDSKEAQTLANVIELIIYDQI